MILWCILSVTLTRLGDAQGISKVYFKQCLRGCFQRSMVSVSAIKQERYVLNMGATIIAISKRLEARWEETAAEGNLLSDSVEISHSSAQRYNLSPAILQGASQPWALDKVSIINPPLFLGLLASWHEQPQALLGLHFTESHCGTFHLCDYVSQCNKFFLAHILSFSFSWDSCTVLIIYWKNKT